MIKKESNITGRNEHGPTFELPAGGRRCISSESSRNMVVVWLNNDMIDHNENYQNTITELQAVVDDVYTFTDNDECVDSVSNMTDAKVCLIICESLGQYIIPCVHDISQIHSILIFGDTEKRQEQRVKKWHKVKGIFTDKESICNELKQIVRRYNQHTVPMSLILPDKKLDQLDPSFMYTQILKEILFTIDFDEEHIKEFINYCCDTFDVSENQLTKFKQFEREYRHKTPIWWYSKENFIYYTLNFALRVMDANVIVRTGFFINDLHRHIERLHKEQHAREPSRRSFTVYRGQGLSSADFSEMVKSQGGLLSFNTFLSTSKDRAVADRLAESNADNPDLVGIVFVIMVDPSKSTTPYAYIREISYFFDEGEVLFSMHAVCRIRSITPTHSNNRLFEISLSVTDDSDKDLCILTERIKQDRFSFNNGWLRLGPILHEIGYSDYAIKIYEISLSHTIDEVTKAAIYKKIGLIQSDMGEYSKAMLFYEKSLAIFQNTFPLDINCLASCYNRIGDLYFRIGDFSKTISSCKKALALQQQSSTPDRFEENTSYYTMGLAYYRLGDHTKALFFSEGALSIWQQLLPNNHPDLALSYNSVGNAYYSIHDYPKALSFYEKALTIQRQSLPSNNPDIATSYNNIGNVYYSMGDYSNAHVFQQKALSIQQQWLPSNHPDLTFSCSNIGSIYLAMGDYLKALSFFEKAHTIRLQLLPANHPDLISEYKLIGCIYHQINDYSKALSFFEKALKFEQQSLPENHPDIAASYKKIGCAYYMMGDYIKGFASFEKGCKTE
ncbi:unnamed protein product [Adineta ricciae]|uniref:Uncharacterized protein n=4 Tax=Adineta ricciae TaxID=249248 RepID=A0A813UXI1_ADIRI|nr:unnamed protein product [Adineta ricciae]